MNVIVSCRLHFMDSAWYARTQDQNQWLQVKFAQRVEIRRVATQGRPNSNQWVKSYTLTYSSDGLLFYQYRTNTNQTVSSFVGVFHYLFLMSGEEQMANVPSPYFLSQFFPSLNFKCSIKLFPQKGPSSSSYSQHFLFFSFLFTLFLPPPKVSLAIAPPASSVAPPSSLMTFDFL